MPLNIDVKIKRQPVDNKTSVKH